jgi:MoxR-like ATPase
MDNNEHIVTTSPTIDETAAACDRILDALETVVVGKRAELQLILGGLLAGGHVLLEDVPGLGKTLIARSLAQVTGLSVGRVQFTPDLMPADVTGSLLYDQSKADFHFRPGPIFNNVVLGDEINRAPPKTQAALLEAMQERQVTVDGVSHALPAPFIVIATQNPIEFEGTYPLPEAQIDRFMLRTSIGYPSESDDAEIIQRRLNRRTDQITLDAVADEQSVRALQAALEDVVVGEPVVNYCVSLVHATRSSPDVHAGASPRGVEALVKLARARAAMSRRGYVIPDDVKAIAVPALAHRIVLRPELWIRGAETTSVVSECLASVPTPPTLPAQSCDQSPATADE